MLSNQFIEIMNICEENKIKVSYEQLALLSRIDKDIIKAILREVAECPPFRKYYYLNIMLSKDYIIHPYYFEILDLILDIKEEYLSEFIDLLNTPKIIRLPYFYDYINIYFIITSMQDGINDYSVRRDILNFIPEADGVYSREHMRLLLMEKINDEYLNLIKRKALITFEDKNKETDELIKEIEYKYALCGRCTKLNPMRLERKKKTVPDNIIKVNFKEDV